MKSLKSGINTNRKIKTKIKTKPWLWWMLSISLVFICFGSCKNNSMTAYAADNEPAAASDNNAKQGEPAAASDNNAKQGEPAAASDNNAKQGEPAAASDNNVKQGEPAAASNNNAKQDEEAAEVDYDAVQNETENKLFSEFDFTQIDDSLKKIFPDKKMGFQELVTALISGKGENAGKLVMRFISDQLNYEFRYNKQNLAYMLLIAIIAAVFTNFSNAFQNRQVSEISFYVLYMLLITMCLNAFRIAMSGIEGKLEVLLDFMRVLCPSYFLAVAIASGSSSSLVFYNIVLFLIYIAEVLILKFLLPIVNIYIMVQVMNYLAGEEYLSQLGELLKKLISWILRTLITCVIGINLIQGMLAPVIDALKRSALTKTAAAIPGIGNAIGGVTDVVLGAAILIKNGIGVAGAAILISICAVPILQMMFMTIMYKLAAALVQPVSDKRITGCISSVSEGYELLVKVIFSTGLLFLLTIAVVTVATS